MLRVLALSLVLPALVSSASGQALSDYRQLSFVLDGVPIPHTEWGAAEVTFTGDPAVQFFNLNVDGRWVIQELPMVSHAGDGVANTITVHFDLGVSRGVDISGTTQRVGFALTPVPNGDPGLGAPTVVGADTDVFSSGIEGVPATLPPAPAMFLALADREPETAKHERFPNQDCGVNECVPTAVSNSLRFLKRENPNAGWGNLDISIDAMKPATRWTRRNGSPLNWERDKDLFMRNNNYPVATRNTQSFAEAMQAIRRGEVVELAAGGHCVAVAAITRLPQGHWQLLVAHDRKQGEQGGPTHESVRFHPTTQLLSGGPGFLHGQPMRTLVIESVRAAECFLMAGLGRMQAPVLGDPADVLLLDPLALWPVSQTTIPDLPVPNRSELLGLHVYFQIVMYSPEVYPVDPMQLSNGLDVVIGGSLPTTFGTPTGIRIWSLAPAAVGGLIQVRFSIPPA